jgi:hypothetical protein
MIRSNLFGETVLLKEKFYLKNIIIEEKSWKIIF